MSLKACGEETSHPSAWGRGRSDTHRETLGRAGLPDFPLCGKKSPSLARSEALFHPHNNLITVSNEEYGDASMFPLPLP